MRARFALTGHRVIAWSFTLASAFILGTAWLGAAQTNGVAASPQGMLDFLAKPLPAGNRMSLPESFPARYADWTEAQRKSGFQLMAQRCGLINALEHDNPAARLLPQPMTMRDEAELAVGVCLPAKMPDDWPDRGKYLEDAQRLIAKARSYGSDLHLPTNLGRN